MSLETEQENYSPEMPDSFSSEQPENGTWKEDDMGCKYEYLISPKDAHLLSHCLDNSVFTCAPPELDKL